MHSDATVKNKDGIKESHGYCYLDLLKHATKIIIESLDETDRFSLITYSTKARCDYRLNSMTKKNKEEVIKILEKLEDEYCTNIWDGLKLSLD